MVGLFHAVVPGRPALALDLLLLAQLGLGLVGRHQLLLSTPHVGASLHQLAARCGDLARLPRRRQGGQAQAARLAAREREQPVEHRVGQELPVPVEVLREHRRIATGEEARAAMTARGALDQPDAGVKRALPHAAFGVAAQALFVARLLAADGKARRAGDRYPLAARRAGLEGLVLLSITVDDRGRGLVAARLNRQDERSLARSLARTLRSFAATRAAHVERSVSPGIVRSMLSSKALYRKQEELTRLLHDTLHGARFDELDGQLWLDDVLVPWERVFLTEASPEPVASWLFWHQLYCWLAKAEFTLGLALACADALALKEHEATIDYLVDLIIDVQTVRTCQTAAELDPERSEEGFAIPNRSHVAAGSIAMLKARQRMAELLRTLPGSSPGGSTACSKTVPCMPRRCSIRCWRRCTSSPKGSPPTTCGSW